MNTVVSVDPGKHQSGVAIFRNGRLAHASLIDVPGVSWVIDMIGILGVETLVIERPEIYTRRTNKNPDDMIDVAISVGRWIEIVSHDRLKLVLPKMWKGQVPKEVMNKRVEARLNADERDGINRCAKSLMHNVWDAIGIGLWHLGRL